MTGFHGRWEFAAYDHRNRRRVSITVADVTTGTVPDLARAAGDIAVQAVYKASYGTAPSGTSVIAYRDKDRCQKGHQ